MFVHGTIFYFGVLRHKIKSRPRCVMVDSVDTVDTVDTGDTGNTVDTVDTGNTGDTGDTGDTGEGEQTTERLLLEDVKDFEVTRYF